MSRSKINHNAVQDLLLSKDVQDFLYKTAENLIAGENRYTVEKDNDNTERTSVTIRDSHRDAISNEIKTGRLGRISKGNK